MKKAILFLMLIIVFTWLNAEPAAGINQFGFDVLKKIDPGEANLVISPFSIYSALAMTAEGADGQTLNQMCDVLQIKDQKSFQKEFSDLQKQLAEAKLVDLEVANALYLADNYKILDEFSHVLRQNYKAELMRNDYNLASINKWVNDKTHGKISKILDRLDPMSKVVILNAIYFYGRWDKQFKERLTRKEDFFSAKGHLNVDMMNQTGRFAYYEDSELQMMQMKYTDHNYSMLIMLPRERNGTGSLIKNLDETSFLSMKNKLSPERLQVSIPRFKIEFKKELSALLKELGMIEAFSPKADFSRISGQKDLYIDLVMHKGYIDVDEAGSEAAAATAVVMKMESAGPPATPIIFNADHPFLFFIMQDDASMILFSGIVNNPGRE